MEKKRIFILNGHPAQTSLSSTLAETYAAAANLAGHEIRLMHLHDLTFDSDFEFGGYRQFKPLEPALEEVLQNIEWCQHLVLTSPMWWGGLPAKLKGLIDRSFLPGRAVDTRVKDGAMPKPMLSGRTARVILTSDTPGWFMRLAYKNALIWQLRRQILGFVGIKPSKYTWFAGASHPKPGVVDRWLKTVKGLGAVAA